MGSQEYFTFADFCFQTPIYYTSILDQRVFFSIGESSRLSLFLRTQEPPPASPSQIQPAATREVPVSDERM